jgi:hemolysin activation/secretion protein
MGADIRSYLGPLAWIIAAIGVGAFADIQPAAAQAAGDPSGLRDRVGPKAEPLPTPDYAAPTAPVVPPRAGDQAAPPTGPATGLMLGDVQVDAAPGPSGQVTGRGLSLSGADGPRIEARRHEALDAAWVRRQFELNGMIGRETSADRVVALVLAINRVFLANGYVNSGVLLGAQGWPASGGVLKLRLINGRVAPAGPGQPGIAVAWTKGGRKGLTARYVRDRLPAASQVPFNGAALERDFRLLAEDPAIRTVNAQLNPGAHAGEATLALSVDPQPRVDAYVSIANSRSPSVGGDRVAVGGSVRNALVAGDVISAEGGLTSGTADGTIAYSAPLTPDTRFRVRYATDGAAVVDESLRALDIHSAETTYEVGLSHTVYARPLTPIAETGRWSPAESLVIGAQWLHRTSNSTLLGLPFSFSPGSVNGRSDYSVMRLSADWVQRGERQVLALSATGSFGLNGSGSDVPGVSAPAPDFKTLLGQLNYARRLNGGSLELRARLAGQLASGLLYSGERFAVGGQDTVRGYRENLLLSDDGAVGSVEISCSVRLDAVPCAKAVEDWKSLRAGVFVDGAVVKNEAGTQPAPTSISSVGIDLTWAPSTAVLARVTYGHALRYVPPTGRPDLQDRGFSFEVTVHPLSLFLRR